MQANLFNTQIIFISQKEWRKHVSVATDSATPQTLGTSETTPARVLRNSSPVYPPDALNRGLEGLVLLRVTVGATGRVSTVEIARSSGVRELDESAREAVQQWQFQPARRNGKAVEWTASLPVRFRLN